MKLLAFVLCLIAAPAFAAEPVFVTRSDSSYSVSFSTISVSSTAVTSISAARGDVYQKVFLQDVTGGASFYYTIGTSTQSVNDIGQLHKATQDPLTIETNDQINLRKPVGAASTVINVMTKRK